MTAPALRCPHPDDWLLLVDGELTENRAVALRDHAAGCSACARRLGSATALVERLGPAGPCPPPPGAVAALMARLQEPRPVQARGRRPLILGGLAGLAVAAALLLAVRPAGEAPDGFTARGAPSAWSMGLGVELWALESPLRRLDPGAAVPLGTPLVIRYANANAGPAWLLAFALDAAGESHWFYPAFLDAATDPPAVRLEPGASRRALGDAAVLEGLSPGPVRFVLVLSPAPLKVSDVERLPPAERAPEALRRRFPGARVEVVEAQVGEEARP